VSFEVVPTLYRLIEVADFSYCLEDGREWTRTNSSEMGFQLSEGLLVWILDWIEVR